MGDHANLSGAVRPSQRGLAGLIGESAQMRRLHELIQRAGTVTSSVLVLGETGTGKELVAQAIHFRGVRGEKPLVPIDCTALSPALIESELFGYVKGAFTGADSSRPGLLQAADEGTIFLDEIAELPVHLQAKLLRTLQEKRVRPVGSTEQIPIDVRVIAATNRDLEQATRTGRFRQDLFFRLNVIQMRLPPLRERKVDIPLLVAHFLEKSCESLQAAKTISEEALQQLLAYDWPGNVRELENAIEYGVALSTDSVLQVSDLPTSVIRVDGNSSSDIREDLFSLDGIERRAILRALGEADGDKAEAAHLLGIGKSTIYRKLREYSLCGHRS